ncbi:hypothetical protein BJV78DRAFT_1239615 [Lactifluus subvellereus]|nr:hypothetical protein BJV78DRAFT_1239615 [Lactifluus subvellereus]
MPAERVHRSTTLYRDRRCNDPDYDTYIQDTLTRITASKYSSLRHAARCTGEQIPNTTLGDRAKGRHDTWQSASAKRQLFSPEQEDMLVKWCELRASMGEPWAPADIQAQAEERRTRDVQVYLKSLVPVVVVVKLPPPIPLEVQGMA